MSFRNRFLVAFGLLLLGLSTSAQMVQPVKWKFSARQISADEVELVLAASIDEGWHIYGQHIPEGGPVATAFTFESMAGIKLVGDVKPETPAEKVFDKVFSMNIELFERSVTFRQMVQVSTSHDTVRGTVTFMACNDHQCVSPEEVEFAILVQDGERGIATISASSESHEGRNRSLWGIFLAGILGGFAAFLMPCIFPMLPLTVSYFTKAGKKGKAFGQAALYGGSIVVIYVALGLLVTLLFGADALNDLSTNGVFNLFFFALLVVFAFSFLGAFELTLPASWSNRLDSKVDGGGALGIFFMAATLALVSFSCTGPIIGTLLVETASRGELLGPAVGMLGFSIALALPFTLFSLFPSWLQSLPKSGGWLNAVKVTLGFLELGLAMKFLSNVDLAYHWEWFDREVFLVAWIAISGLLAIYLLGKLRLPHDSDVQHIGPFRLMLATVMLAFTLYMVPGLWGAPLKAISAFLPPPQTQDFDLYSRSLMVGVSPDSKTAGELRRYGDIFEAPYGLDAYFDYEEGLAHAKKVNKPVMIDFTGHACVNCRQMEASVWSDRAVLERIRNGYVLVQLFVDDKTSLPEAEWYTSAFSGKKIKTLGGKWSDLQASQYHANSQPYYVLLSSDGKLLTQPQGAEYDVLKFAAYLDRGLHGSIGSASTSTSSFR